MYVYVNLSMYECISGAGEPAGGRRGDGAYYQRCRSDGVRNGCGEHMRKIWYYMGNGRVGLMRVMG